MADLEEPRIACATVLTHPSYLRGALVLGHSLRAAGWGHETLALVTREIGQGERRALARDWSRIVETGPIDNPNPRSALVRPEFLTTYTKLRVWEHDEYTKIVYLDADTLVTGPLDDLLARGDFAAAPCLAMPDEFNSGVMVLRPSRHIFQDMVAQVATLPSRDGSDQGFLNRYVPDWYRGDASQRLPVIYNVPQFAYVLGNWNTLQPEMRVLHFVGPKPWKVGTALGRRVVSGIIHRLPFAPSGAPSPFDLWWQTYGALAAEAR